MFCLCVNPSLIDMKGYAGECDATSQKLERWEKKGGSGLETFWWAPGGNARPDDAAAGGWGFRPDITLAKLLAPWLPSQLST